MEELLVDAPCFRRFAGIGWIEDRIPDVTTMLNFRHRLAENWMAAQLLESINHGLREKGMLFRKSATLDATIIHAPSSTKIKLGERDLEMHWVAKGNLWFFGMRNCIGVEAASGLVHAIVNTTVNAHDLTTAAERVHVEERVIYGDAAPIKWRSRMYSTTTCPRWGSP